MEYLIISNEESVVTKLGDQYGINDPTVTSLPSEEEFVAAVKLFESEFENYGIKSQFRDEPAICLLDEEDDEPTYILGAELSNEEAVTIKTIELIAGIMERVSPNFRFFLTFEYNYIGFDFACYFSGDSVKFCFNDDISQEKFGISS